jgi:hypothetical protein
MSEIYLRNNRQARWTLLRFTSLLGIARVMGEAFFGLDGRDATGASPSRPASWTGVRSKPASVAVLPLRFPSRFLGKHRFYN